MVHFLCKSGKPVEDANRRLHLSDIKLCCQRESATVFAVRTWLLHLLSEEEHKCLKFSR